MSVDSLGWVDGGGVSFFHPGLQVGLFVMTDGDFQSLDAPRGSSRIF